MNIEEFLQLKDCGRMSHAQSRLLNIALASTKLNGFNSEGLLKIEEYLTTALNIEAVESELVEYLQDVVSTLQQMRLT